MKRLAAVFLTIPPVWAVAFVFLVPALETALVLGVVVPGELTIVLGGALAARGRAPLPAVLAAAVAGANAGDIVGYFLGRRYGEHIIRRKLKKKWGRAHRWLSSKGQSAAFLGRFLPFLRSVLPTTAGAMAIAPRRFLPWDLAAASIWAAASVFLGYFAARDFERLLRALDRISVIAAIAVAAVIVGMIWLRKRRRSRRSAARSR
jgi:membrane-associated protein